MDSSVYTLCVWAAKCIDTTEKAVTTTHDGHLYERFDLSHEDIASILREYRAIAWQFEIHGTVLDKPYHWSRIHLVEGRSGDLEDLLTLCGRYTASLDSERVAEMIEGEDAYLSNTILPCAVCHYIWNARQG